MAQSCNAESLGHGPAKPLFPMAGLGGWMRVLPATVFLAAVGLPAGGVLTLVVDHLIVG